MQLAINAPLRQRIAVKYVMEGLKPEELPDYIGTRLKAAGLHENIFTQTAIEAIYSASKGIPRLVNSLATASLMYACSIKQRHIDGEIVYQGQKDFDM